MQIISQIKNKLREKVNAKGKLKSPVTTFLRIESTKYTQETQNTVLKTEKENAVEKTWEQEEKITLSGKNLKTNSPTWEHQNQEAYGLWERLDNFWWPLKRSSNYKASSVVVWPSLPSGCAGKPVSPDELRNDHTQITHKVMTRENPEQQHPCWN